MFSVMGRQKLQTFKIRSSILTIYLTSMKKSSSSSSSSIIGGVISLSLEASDMQARYRGLVQQLERFDSASKNFRKISMARKTVSGANYRKFLWSIMEEADS